MKEKETNGTNELFGDITKKDTPFFFFFFIICALIQCFIHEVTHTTILYIIGTLFICNIFYKMYVFT